MSAETGRPTMHEVARVAGVSHATVSRVLNGHTNVAPATARAVADAIIITGYVPNRAARSLRVQSTDTVVLVAREKVDVFYNEPTLSPMASGANLRLSEHGYQMLLALVDSPRSAERVGSLIAGGILQRGNFGRHEQRRPADHASHGHEYSPRNCIHAVSRI